MAKKVDYVSLKDVGEEWGCLEAPEELKFWTLLHGWKKDFFKRNKLKISTVSVKAAKIIGEASTTRYNKRAPLVLPNGFELFEGTVGLTSQNKVASYPNIPIDGVEEFNEIMKHLSVKDEIKVWTVTAFAFWNEKMGAKIKFRNHSPNEGTARSLYLDRVWDETGERPYANISYYDQQSLCNYFSNTTAACVKRMIPQVDCKIKILEEMGRAGK